MQKKNKNRFLYFVISFILIGGTIFLRDVTGISINKYIILMLCSIVLVFAPSINHFWGIVAFMIPLYGGMPNNYLTLVVLATLFLKFKQKYTYQWLIVVIISSIYELIHFVYSPFSFYDYIIDMIYIIIFFVMVFILVDAQIDKSVLAYSFALGVIVVSSIILIITLEQYSFGEMLNGGIRLGTIFEKVEGELSVELNSNTIALYSAVSIGFLFCLKKNTLGSVILIFLLTISGLITVSRNFIFSMIILLVLMLLTAKWKRKIWILVVSVVSMFAINRLYPTVFENLLERFQVADLSGGRMDISAEYIEQWTQRMDAMLWGVGIQEYQAKYNITASIHNATFEILLIWGIIGLILFSGVILFVFVKNKKKYKISKMGMCVFITFIFSIQFSRIISTPETLLLFGFSFIILFDEEKKHSMKNYRLKERCIVNN